MEGTFETYLYQKSSAVYLDPLGELALDITLLDVLCKEERAGGCPVLRKAGSMLNLGTTSSSESQEMLRAGLRGLQENGSSEGDLITWSYLDREIDATFPSIHSLKGSLLGGPNLGEAEAHFSESRNVHVNSEGLATMVADKKQLIEIVTGKGVGRLKQWKPNIDDPMLKWPDQPCCCLPMFERFWSDRHDRRKLWVIHQIIYASKLEITADDSASTGGKVTCNIVPGAPGPVGFTTSREVGPNKSVLNLKISSRPKYPDKFMFAFRALCFHFNAAGDCVDYEFDAGKSRPTHRGEDDGPFNNEREQISGLFVENPPIVIPYSEDDLEVTLIQKGYDLHRLEILGSNPS